MGVGDGLVDLGAGPGDAAGDGEAELLERGKRMASWQPTTAGATSAFDNCEGWTTTLAALQVWLEHGIKREGFYR